MANPQPLAFVERSRVLPLESHAGVRLDIVFGVLPIQREAILRAAGKPIGGRMIPVASVEELAMVIPPACCPASTVIGGRPQV
jgi:hypothetical protein